VSAYLAPLLAVAGALCGPLQRSRIVRLSVAWPEEDEQPPPWRSACPACDRTLAAVLPPTGRCPRCGARIGPPPVTVEALTAAVFGVLALGVHDGWLLGAACWVAALGVVLAFVDVGVHRLPDQLTLSAFAGAATILAAGAAVEHDLRRVGLALLGGLGYAAFYLLLVVIYPAGMGTGDAKLALSLGTVMGWSGWTYVVLGGAAGVFLAGVFSVVALMAGRIGRKTMVAHGPFMMLGTLAAVMLAG
jgi:leader peptidase (prepilin peptidase)/N-methyltransferase